MRARCHIDKSVMAGANHALRPGLTVRAKQPGTARFKVEPHAFGFKQGITTDRLNQLADELEAEEATRRVTLRRHSHRLVGRS